jgi:hypothetical protein
MEEMRIGSIEIGELARLVAIVAAQAVPGVVELVECVGELAEPGALGTFEQQAVDLSTVHHPVERDIGEPVL